MELKEQTFIAIIEKGLTCKRNREFNGMIEHAVEAKEFYKEKIEGHQMHGEALVMIGQEEMDTEKAIL